MITVSLCMIVRDEEENLPNCLDSVKDLVDEIIIVDTGSRDQTKAVAAAYGAKIYDFPWVDNFSAARNVSLAHATRDYLLWLDADDILLPEDQEKFRLLKETLDPAVDIVMMKYHAGFDSKGKVTFSYYRSRLLKREKGYRFQDPIHEFIPVSGKTIESSIAVTHTNKKGSGTRNLDIYRKMKAKGLAFTPRNTYYYAKELYYNGFYAPAIEEFETFLKGEGWVEDKIWACREASLCHTHLKQTESALEILYRSFIYDLPRPEICCLIGDHYRNREEYRRAIYWYELALEANPAESWAFRMPECSGYLPCIHLCVCYHRLGKIEQAIHYNNLAGEHKPDDASVQYNKDFFSQLEK